MLFRSKQGSNLYPVHYAGSDTSGEKGYEEFYTEEETIDLNRLSALGIVVNKKIPAKDKIEKLFVDLNQIFESAKPSKEEILGVMKEYLPNFEHIETGKSLDSKM